MKAISDKLAQDIYRLILNAGGKTEDNRSLAGDHVNNVIKAIDQATEEARSKRMGLDAVLYQLMGLPMVNLNMYRGNDCVPDYVTLGHYVIARQNAEDFDLTPGKSYLVEGVGSYDTLVVTNDTGKRETYSVECFSRNALDKCVEVTVNNWYNNHDRGD